MYHACFVRVSITLGLMLGGFLAADSAAAEEGTWLQWRGPERTGQLAEGAFPESLDEEHLTEAWSVELSPSYSTPIVTEDRVFVTETVDQKDERVRALDRTTGEEIWQTSWPGAIQVPFFAASNGSWIRATPIYDSGRLFVPGMRDVLVCLDAATGDRLWEVDFVKEFESPLPGFGCVCSPLIEGEFLYIQAGAGLVKVNKNDGEVLWRVLVDDGGMQGSAFSSPVSAEINGTDQVVVQTRKSLAGVDPDTGAVLWTQEVPAFRGMNILTPLVQENQVFTSTYGGKTWLYDIAERGEETQIDVAWSTNQQGYMSSPVVIDGHVYLHLKNDRFTCLEWKSGDRKWTTEPMGDYWSMVASGDRILALNEKGELFLIRANPEKFDLIDQRQVSDDSTWAHLVVAGNELYVRTLGSLMKFEFKP